MSTATVVEAPRIGRLSTPTGRLVLPSTATREEWLTARKQGITATDVVQIVGASQYGSAMDVYADKRGAPLREDELTEAGEWGVALEDYVAQRWAEKNDLRVRRIGLISKAEDPWYMASLDRLVLDCEWGTGRGARCGVEVKTRNAFTASQWDDDAIPDSITTQVQVQLDVSGLDHIHVAALIGGQRLVERVVVADPVTQGYLRGEGRRVWDAVNAGIPPVVDPALLNIDLLNRIYPNREGVVELPTDVTAEAVALLADYAEANEIEKQAKAAKARIKVQLLTFIGDGEEAKAFDGRTLFTYNQGKDKTEVSADNAKRLLADHPEFEGDYVDVKPGSRTFSPKKVA